MTTTVIVKANHGWPVDVTPQQLGEHGGPGKTVRVPPNTQEIFHVHSGADLLIHEVQPHEIEADTTPKAESGPRDFAEGIAAGRADFEKTEQPE